ncbi:hypothetical protein RB595_009190 [Gaeumannomyces hyphopodioides]
MQSRHSPAPAAPSPTPAPAERYVFSYGVNMQEPLMRLKCGDVRAVGLARLPGHTWIVNAVGVANVVPTGRLREVLEALREAAEAGADVPSSPRVGGGGGGGVYGVLYELLSPCAEERLDEVQDVVERYQKRLLEVQLVRPAAQGPPGSTEAVGVPAIVYLNLNRRCIVPRWPREAGYARKMNAAIAYAQERFHMPNEYVKKSLRPTIAESIEFQRYSQIDDLDEILLQPILDQVDVKFWR